MFFVLQRLLRATLPDPGKVPAAKALYTETWRGLWRLVNLFQGARGLHVEFNGLDTLAAPDMSEPDPSTGNGAADAAWEEARALCDEAFHPLIAAESPGPEHLGDDLVVGGRVVGAMEFGWAGARVAVAETAHASRAAFLTALGRPFWAARACHPSTEVLPRHSTA